MKTPSQLEVIKSVRKPVTPPTRIERPMKGKNAYRRFGKHKKEFHIED